MDLEASITERIARRVADPTDESYVADTNQGKTSGQTAEQAGPKPAKLENESSLG